MIITKFNSDDIVSGRTNQVSSGLFNGTASIAQATLTTSSQGNLVKTVDSSSGSVVTTYNNIYTDPVAKSNFAYDIKNTEYYLNVNVGEETFFSIAYGDVDGTGSSIFNPDDYSVTSSNPIVLNSETKAIYSQYKNILLPPGNDLFTFISSSMDSSSVSITANAIFAINFSADKMKDQIDPGQLQINFSGSKGEISLIDDSYVINKKQQVYNLIRGSIIDGMPTPHGIPDESGSTVSGEVVYEGVGLFYPSNGIIILNAEKLNELTGLIYSTDDKDYRAVYNNSYSYIVSTTSPDDNYTYGYRLFPKKLFNAMKQSSAQMYVRKSEFVPSTTYFIRVKNKEYNYSNNPTLVSDGTMLDSSGNVIPKGQILYQELIDNPRTYPTSVGLYNDNNELLAIAKLSRPFIKSFDNELLIKCRIDY